MLDTLIGSRYLPAMKAIATAGFLDVIPAAIRQRLGWQPGIVLEFDEYAPWLIAKPAFEANPVIDIEEMMSCIGCGVGKGGYNGLSSSEWLDETRGPVEIPPENP